MAEYDFHDVPEFQQSATACCPRETIPDSCSCLEECLCECMDCDCGWRCDDCLGDCGDGCHKAGW